MVNIVYCYSTQIIFFAHNFNLEKSDGTHYTYVKDFGIVESVSLKNDLKECQIASKFFFHLSFIQHSNTDEAIVS